MLNGTCPKCGEDDAKPTYHSQELGVCKGKYTRERGEHLHYTCQTCGYDWVSPTKDFVKPDEPIEEPKRQAYVIKKPVVLWSGVPKNHQSTHELDEACARDDSRCSAATRYHNDKHGIYRRCGNRKARGSSFCGTHKKAEVQAGLITWEQAKKLLEDELNLGGQA